MVFMTVAMYCEASVFINYFRLKKDVSFSKYQVFRNEIITLIICGTGKISAAIGTAILLSEYNAKKTDIFINAGICGSKKYSVYDVVMCNKLTDSDSGKSYYPDMIYTHPFKEGSLETFGKVINSDADLKLTGALVDMEGTGAYEAAAVFLPPQQIHILKVVSDSLNGANLKPQVVTNIMNKNIEAIGSWIKERQGVKTSEIPILSAAEENNIIKLSENMKLTMAMKYKFIHLAKNYKIRSSNLEKILTDYKGINCKSKNEGKIYFGKLKKQLSEL